MKNPEIKAHYIDEELLQPTDPIAVILIGAGGTGSQVLTALARMNHALTALGHAGLQLTLWDDDTVAQANLGRQLFAPSEVGLYKAQALIARCNRFFGTHWKAVTKKFGRDTGGNLPIHSRATLYISCVDSAAARFGIAEILTALSGKTHYRNAPKYWMDFGNSRASGQVILSTIGTIKQPCSKAFTTVDSLPFVTSEFGELLNRSEQQDDTPSCSLAEALEKQDLFINSTLAQMGCALLWNLLKDGQLLHRGIFLNLEGFRSQPLPL